MGRAIMYEYSFRNQLGILSGPDALLGLSFCRTFCTRSSVTFKNSGESSNGRRVQEELTFGIPPVEIGRLHLWNLLVSIYLLSFVETPRKFIIAY